MPQALDQADRRREFNVWDEFGREYLATIELVTGDPVRLEPCKTDQHNIPGKFLRVDPMNPRVLVIDFQSWYDELVQSEREYDQQRHLIGQQLYGERYDENEPPTKRMLDQMGAPPRSPADVPRVIDALMAEAVARGRRPTRPVVNVRAEDLAREPVKKAGVK